MFRQALSFPFRGKGGGKTFVLGGVAVFALLLGQGAAIGALSEIAELVEAGESVPDAYYGVLGGGALVAFVCYLLLVGFAPRVLAAAARGRDEIPPFGRLTALLADGGRVMGVKAGYLLPALVLAGVSRGLAVAPLSGTVRAVAQAVAALMLLVFLLYMVALFYVVPAAVTLFGLEGNVRAAFDFGRLERVVVSEDYAVGWVVGIVVFVLGMVLASLLLAAVLGVFAVFHANAAARYCYGVGVGRSLGLRGGDVDEEREDADTAPRDPMAPEVRRRYDW